MKKEGNGGVGNPMIRALGASKPDRNWWPEDFQWYLKWIASLFVMASLMMRAAGVEYRMYDLYLGWLGIVLWIWVSVIWRDRALIMLNTVSFFMLTVAIMKEWPDRRLPFVQRRLRYVSTRGADTRVGHPRRRQWRG